MTFVWHLSGFSDRVKSDDVAGASAALWADSDETWRYIHG